MQCKPHYVETDGGCPFGYMAGFLTNLGIVSPPKEPINGYVYSGGTGESTWYTVFPTPGG